MSGIQVEANQDARFDEEVRLDFADALADVTLTYLWEHYQLDVAP